MGNVVEERMRWAEAKARGFDPDHDCTECGNRILRHEGMQLVCATCGTEHDLNLNMAHKPEDKPLKIIRPPDTSTARYLDAEELRHWLD
jgi:uncharacterized Zn finger protein (UPF0148 family)